MTELEGLYDVEHKEFPPGERGDHFRSLQIYQCKICHSKTNRWFYGGAPGWGLRHTCPAQPEFPEEHRILESSLGKLSALEKEISRFRIQADRDESLKEDVNLVLPLLYAQTNILRSHISELRKRLSQMCDINGIDPNPSQIIEFYPSTKAFKTHSDFHKFGGY